MVVRSTTGYLTNFRNRPITKIKTSRFQFKISLWIRTQWKSHRVFCYNYEFVAEKVATLYSSRKMPWVGNSCIVDIEINAWSRSFVNLQIKFNLNSIFRMVILPRRWRDYSLIRSGFWISNTKVPNSTLRSQKLMILFSICPYMVHVSPTSWNSQWILHGP